jgi:hypothetical protein
MMAACGGRAPEAAAPATAASGPCPPVTATSEWVAGIVREPSRLRCAIDADRGVTWVRLAGCEIDPPVQESQHLCGAAIDTQEPGLRERLIADLSDLPAPEAIVCTSSPRTQCVVPAMGECNPEVTLVFGEIAGRGTAVTAIVQRDDWQTREIAAPEAKQAIHKHDQFIDASLQASVGASCR